MSSFPMIHRPRQRSGGGRSGWTANGRAATGWGPIGRARELAVRRPRRTGVEQVAGHAAAHARPRSVDGPIDRAQYTCSCGYVFEARVSTTVDCPHCGFVQAW